MANPIRVPELQSWQMFYSHMFSGYKIVCECDVREVGSVIPIGAVSVPAPITVELHSERWRNDEDGIEIAIWSGICHNCGREYQDWAWRNLP